MMVMAGDMVAKTYLGPEEVADAALVVELHEEAAISEDEGARHRLF